MRAATLQEMELMNEAIFPRIETKGGDKVVSKAPSQPLPDEKVNRTYFFKNANGYVYATSQDIPRDPSDTILDASLRSVHFSGAQRRLMMHFEPVSQPRDEKQGDLFPETIRPIEDTMHYYVSEMLKILIAEGVHSSQFARIPKKETVIRTIQTPLISWDPNKGREVETFSERRVYSTKTRIAYMLAGR